MKSATGIWDVLTNAILVLLFVAVLVAVAVWYSPLIKENQTMRAEIQRLKREGAQEDERKRQLDSTIALLRTDRKSQERLIREYLGYAKSDEMVFRFVEPVAPAPAPRAPAAGR